MSRYDEMFARLNRQNEKAFVPFTVIGDPSIEASEPIIGALVEGGADALELGIPFSDPVADGPTIQAAGVRALSRGATPPKCFARNAETRACFCPPATTVPRGLWRSR